jgi:glycosyltransferase involved in cell wall biosynthesis
MSNKIKALWFVNMPFPAVCDQLNVSRPHGGSWIIALGERLVATGQVRLRVVCQHQAVSESRVLPGSADIDYVVVPHYGSELRNVIAGTRLGRLVLGAVNLQGTEQLLEHCLDEVARFSPDLVHFHGSEAAFGLLAPHIHMPSVLSLQGILDVYRRHFWGNMPFLERLRYPQHWLRYREFLSNARRERRVFAAVNNYIGHTQWDKRHQRRLNPNAAYFEAADCLRPEFYETSWQLNRCNRHTILTTTSTELWKGTDTVIDALASLREELPGLQLRIIGPLRGNWQGRRLLKRTERLGVRDRVTFLGQQDAVEIAAEISRAHVYVIASHIENTANNFSEAQISGLPCVAASAGGLTDFVQHGRTGLLFQPGNHTELARHLRSLLTDDALAADISRAGSKAAHARLDRDDIVQRHLAIYRQLITPNT